MRGARICVEARPAPIHVPMHRVQVTSSPIACFISVSCVGLLVLAVVGLALDERLANEARDLVAGDRPRGLEGRQAEEREVDGGHLLERPLPRRRDAADRPETGHERADDRRVGAVGRLFGHR